MKFQVVVCALTLLVVVVSAVPYPLDASWFANRWTLSDWMSTLTEFQQTGGSIVWQRGAPFRPRSSADILADPDFVWCWALEKCTEKAVTDAAALGAKLVTWFTYQNDEDYDL